MSRTEHKEIVDGKNRWTYHVVVALMACVLTALFWAGGFPLKRATAGAAFVFLTLVLMIGPAMRLWWRPYLRKLPYGIPFRWRGELGVWFTLLAVGHTLLVWHGRDWQVLPLRHSDLVGLIAVAWAIGLALTSSGRAIRFLGIRQWKWLQTTGAYVIFYLVVVHSIYHVWLRPRFAPGTVGYLYAALLLLVVVLQLTTYTRTVLNARNIRLKASTRMLTKAMIALAFAGLGFMAWHAPDREERVLRVHDWLAEELVIDLRVQTAFNDREIFFRFDWAQPYPGGWYHDLLVFRDGQWQRFSEPGAWLAEGRHGFQEDRLSFKLDDGSVKGFANFGGWLTQHVGVRSLPGAPSREAIEAHPWLGQTLGRTDIRKYLPQSRQGPWWQGDWDKVLPPEELERLKAEGVFLDLVVWRAHRSNAMQHATDHWILDYRHTDEGTSTYRSQRWDATEGPESMFDPKIVPRGALDIDRIWQNPMHYRNDLFYQGREDWLGREEPYYLHEDWMVPFDPQVAQWEGAVIPSTVLRMPEGSVGAWRARGIWRDGRWTLEMSRKLDTGHPDDKTFRPGGLYTWAPAIHHGSGRRWHWVGYPYQLGLGVRADEAGVEPRRFLEAVSFQGSEPDWVAVPTKTIPLIYPGIIHWTWLTSENHLGYREVREDAMSIWDWHDEAPHRLAEMFLMLQ
jgi:hypothetical protein